MNDAFRLCFLVTNLALLSYLKFTIGTHPALCRTEPIPPTNSDSELHDLRSPLNFHESRGRLLSQKSKAEPDISFEDKIDLNQPGKGFHAQCGQEYYLSFPVSMVWLKLVLAVHTFVTHACVLDHSGSREDFLRNPGDRPRVEAMRAIVPVRVKLENGWGGGNKKA
ncbi:hypothetical protein PTTG_25175 [Puccinia triticina 1-1 BBBD Race 1]|uniref:Uncharacterized protein n=1 Tax=Puccinia triticina (isolate 1-1 / race 1 (BBBD)) TaxID=630390 RepID=A0A180H539_PUCT1|nr:hypothetical protein PTTG_25175 [Puccinia triticina 1-1 BBBD Race 1]